MPKNILVIFDCDNGESGSYSHRNEWLEYEEYEEVEEPKEFLDKLQERTSRTYQGNSTKDYNGCYGRNSINSAYIIGEKIL